jgi:hypothetical protein
VRGSNGRGFSDFPAPDDADPDFSRLIREAKAACPA